MYYIGQKNGWDFGLFSYAKPPAPADALCDSRMLTWLHNQILKLQLFSQNTCNNYFMEYWKSKLVCIWNRYCCFFRGRPSRIPRKTYFFLIGSMHSQSRCDPENAKPFRSDMAALEKKGCREVALHDNYHNCLYLGFLMTISCLLKTIKHIYYVIIVLKLKK